MKKFSQKELDKLRAEHKKYNKEMRQLHCHFLQKSFDEYLAYRYGKSTPSKKKEVSIHDKEEKVFRKKDQQISSMNSFGKVTSVINNKGERVYTGNLIKGIGVMHKSNMVPVINNDVAKDLATMRR